MSEEAGRQVRAALDAEIAALNFARDFKTLMSDEVGRRVIWAFLNEFGAFGQLFSESHAMMSYLEGRRQAGLFLMQQINTICPDLYLVMANENTKPPEDDQ